MEERTALKKNPQPPNGKGGETIITKSLNSIESLARLEELADSLRGTLLPPGWSRSLRTAAAALKSTPNYKLDTESLGQLRDWLIALADRLHSIEIIRPTTPEKLTLLARQWGLTTKEVGLTDIPSSIKTHLEESLRKTAHRINEIIEYAEQLSSLEKENAVEGSAREEHARLVAIAHNKSRLTALYELVKYLSQMDKDKEGDQGEGMAYGLIGNTNGVNILKAIYFVQYYTSVLRRKIKLIISESKRMEKVKGADSTREAGEIIGAAKQLLARREEIIGFFNILNEKIDINTLKSYSLDKRLEKNIRKITIIMEGEDIKEELSRIKERMTQLNTPFLRFLRGSYPSEDEPAINSLLNANTISEFKEAVDRISTYEEGEEVLQQLLRVGAVRRVVNYFEIIEEIKKLKEKFEEMKRKLNWLGDIKRWKETECVAFLNNFRKLGDTALAYKLEEDHKLMEKDRLEAPEPWLRLFSNHLRAISDEKEEMKALNTGKRAITRLLGLMTFRLAERLVVEAKHLLKITKKIHGYSDKTVSLILNSIKKNHGEVEMGINRARARLIRKIGRTLKEDADSAREFKKRLKGYLDTSERIYLRLLSLTETLKDILNPGELSKNKKLLRHYARVFFPKLEETIPLVRSLGEIAEGKAYPRNISLVDITRKLALLVNAADHASEKSEEILTALTSSESMIKQIKEFEGVMMKFEEENSMLIRIISLIGLMKNNPNEPAGVSGNG